MRVYIRHLSLANSGRDMITYVCARESTRTQNPKAQVAAAGARGVGLNAACAGARVGGRRRKRSPQGGCGGASAFGAGKAPGAHNVAGIHGATSDPRGETSAVGGRYRSGAIGLAALTASTIALIEAAGETRRDRKRLVPPRDCLHFYSGRPWWHLDAADELARDFARTSSKSVYPPTATSKALRAAARRSSRSRISRMWW
jgi:hypothetical protein